MKKQEKKIKASEFDRVFEEGENVVGYLDLKTAKAHYPVQRINIDIPRDVLKKVDQEAARMGVPRTSLLKIWIAQHADRLAA